jgi:hypothetical protein
MVFVDKIDFSRPIVLIKKGEDESNTKIIGESTYMAKIEENRNFDIYNSLNKKEIYLDLRQPYYLYAARNYFEQPKKATKEIFTLNGNPILAGIYKEIISERCLEIKGDKLPCLAKDTFTLILSEMPVNGIVIEEVIYKSKVVFNDYVIEEESFIGSDIATQKMLFSFKSYNYGGSSELAKTYDPNEEGIFGTTSGVPNQHRCTGETNPQSIKEGGDFLYQPTLFRYLKEHYGYK